MGQDRQASLCRSPDPKRNDSPRDVFPSFKGSSCVRRNACADRSRRRDPLHGVRHACQHYGAWMPPPTGVRWEKTSVGGLHGDQEQPQHAVRDSNRPPLPMQWLRWLRARLAGMARSGGSRQDRSVRPRRSTFRRGDDLAKKVIARTTRLEQGKPTGRDRPRSVRHLRMVEEPTPYSPG